MIWTLPGALKDGSQKPIESDEEYDSQCRSYLPVQLLDLGIVYKPIDHKDMPSSQCKEWHRPQDTTLRKISTTMKLKDTTKVIS